MPVEFDNPLTQLRMLVATALTTFAPLTEALGPNAANLVQVWDRPIDLRGDLAESGIGEQRIQMRPASSGWDFSFSNSAVQFKRRYAIEIYSDDVRAAPVELLEWMIVRAMARLWMGVEPADGLTPIAVPAPLIVDSIAVVQADPEREPIGLDPEKWVSVCDVVVSGQVATAALVDN